MLQCRQLRLASCFQDARSPFSSREVKRVNQGKLCIDWRGAWARAGFAGSTCTRKSRIHSSQEATPAPGSCRRCIYRRCWLRSNFAPHANDKEKRKMHSALPVAAAMPLSSWAYRQDSWHELRDGHAMRRVASPRGACLRLTTTAPRPVFGLGRNGYTGGSYLTRVTRSGKMQ